MHDFSDYNLQYDIGCVASACSVQRSRSHIQDIYEAFRGYDDSVHDEQAHQML